MKDLRVRPDIIIRKAMERLSETGEKCLIVVGERNKLLGTLTDGDLRKAILKGTDFNSNIKKVFNQNPAYLIEGKYTISEAKKLFLKYKFDVIPIVDNNGAYVDFIVLENIFENKEIKQRRKLTVPTVIMAGGKGTRLEPFTKVLPKPLVPIHDKPIIEHIIERFEAHGISEFWLTINYKSLILKAFFEELNPGYTVHFVEEQEPLGTAGSLKFLEEKFEMPFFVTNCDIIVNADYADLYEFHISNGYDITLVASMKHYVIPYGTCELNSDGYLKCFKEKPAYDFLANTGLYVLNPDTLSLIPENQVFHITELIEDSRKNDMKIGVYPISKDAWIDVGQWGEFRDAIDKMCI